MGTTRVRLTLELEINGDIPADACTYFIGRFGNYSGENLEAPRVGGLTPEERARRSRRREVA